MRRAMILGIALCLAAAAPALADKGGHGKDRGPHHVLITDQDRTVVYSFYRTEFVAGRCPPGLARKNDGCLPPGQAKRLWSLGTALPPGVAFYPLPTALIAQLTPPPQGYQYVRVDNDILLMTLGSRIVSGTLGSLAALQDANRPLVVDSERSAIAAYYSDDYLAGNCPAGLVRSDTGCRVKSLWALGEPLDPAVTYEVLPDPLLAQLGPLPDGYQYIRVGDHILMMLIETRVIRADVVDLSRLPLARSVAVAPAVPSAVTVVPGRVEYLGGGCPPGLAKKNNGCLPPGHAK